MKTLPLKFKSQLVAALALLAAGAAESSGEVVAEYTFDDRLTLEAVMSASSVASGIIVGNLEIHADTTFSGLNNLPEKGPMDSYSFGENLGESVLFALRAESKTGTTVWGDIGDDPDTSTYIGDSLFFFTITTDKTTSVTISSITVTGTGVGDVFSVRIQEEGASPGTESEFSNNTVTAFLSTPVVIDPSSSKTFTINLNSNSYGSSHVFNTMSIEGTLNVIPKPTAGTQ